MSEHFPTNVREMTWPQLWKVAYGDGFTRSLALAAQAEIRRRDKEERGQAARRQEPIAWASVAAASLAAIATVALVVIAWW